MAKNNMLPILALGAAAFFLTRKKGDGKTNESGANGTTNGSGANGNTNGNGDGNGDGGEELPETTPEDMIDAMKAEGFVGMKLGDAFVIKPAKASWFFKLLGVTFNGEALSDEEISQVITTKKDANSGQILSMTFKPDRTGSYEIGLQSWDRIDLTRTDPLWIYAPDVLVT